MTGFSNPEVWEMLGRLLPCCCLSPALTHPKDSSTALPLAISAAGGSQSDLERSRGSGDLPSDPEMSGIPSLIPLCLFRAPRAAFTWWHCQEAAGGFSTAVPVTGSGSPWCTRCSVCLRKGWTSRFSFKAHTDQGRCPVGPLQKLSSSPELIWETGLCLKLREVQWCGLRTTSPGLVLEGDSFLWKALIDIISAKDDVDIGSILEVTGFYYWMQWCSTLCFRSLWYEMKPHYTFLVSCAVISTRWIFFW